MKYKRFWLAVVSVFMAAQHNTGEAAAPELNGGHERFARIQASAAEEEAVVKLFGELNYSQVLEMAGAIWSRPESMPDRVLYCVAESYIRSGQAQLAKTSFELLVARAPQNPSFRVGLAYTLLYAGEMEKGLALYRQALPGNQQMLAVAAEDAVALLSQGNISGGKALFQMVIALSPVKDQYLKLYESTVRLYGLMDNASPPRSIEAKVTEKPDAGANNNSKVLPAQTVKNSNDYEVYLSRGMQSLKKEDYRQAVHDLERARVLAPDGPDKAIRLTQVEHDLAVAYIHLGRNEKAASLLANYTKTVPADSLIASDYILALANSAQYELAVQEGERLWPSYTAAPIAGLKPLAESYIRLGKQEKAIAVYRSLAERQSDNVAGWRMLAFQLMLSGRTAEGLSYYDRLLVKNTANADMVAADAEVFLNTDQYIAGKMLFELVLQKYPDQTYRKRYADALMRKNLNLAAYRQYEALSRQPGGQLDGLSGMVRAALALGDYQQFRQALDTIVDKYGRSKAVAAIEASYEAGQWGNVETSYALADHNREAEVRTLGMATSQENMPYFQPAPKKTSDPGNISPETYNGLIDELLQVGKSGVDRKIKIDGEIRFHYAHNSGSGELGKDTAGSRTYIGAQTMIGKDWKVYAVLEDEKSLRNYNNYLKLSRFYVAGKVGSSMISAGSMGFLMAERNIYDSGFKGVRADFGEPVKYTLGYGEIDGNKATFLATARYNDFDYDLEVGAYHYETVGDISDRNTIFHFGGHYRFSNFNLGAMYLRSSLQDSNGSRNGYVISFNYGALRSWRPGTYEIFSKYYNQAKGTYIAHGMNGKGNSMQGFKGYGLGMNYTLAKDFVGGIEYYNLTDKVSGERGKTLWLQLTHYF